MSIAENYRAFALEQARGRSPLYEEITSEIAGDKRLLEFLAALPPEKRQPNLLLAAVRYVAGIQPDYSAFREVVLQRDDEIVRVMMARRTQTNEPARCAVLLPVLRALPQPLALLELGSSAGLTLIPDLYGYSYGSVALHPAVSGAPVFMCHTEGDVPLPADHPTVVWRKGIDLNPLNPADGDDARWLHCLLWPGEGNREDHLTRALEVAADHPAPTVRGDFVDLFIETAAEAPAAATLVVYHSAALAYVSPPRRDRLAELIRDSRAVWLSNEAPGVLPGVTAEAPRNGESGAFLLVRDGSEPLALSDSHGSWLRWIAR